MQVGPEALQHKGHRGNRDGEARAMAAESAEPLGGASIREVLAGRTGHYQEDAVTRKGGGDLLQ